MKITSLLLGGVLALGTGLPLVAHAQQSPGQSAAPAHAAGRHRGMMSNLRGLNLSDQQRTQIKQIVSQYRSAHPKGSSPDPQARKAMRDQVMSLLTPDQQSQFKANARRARQERLQNEQAPQPQATPS